MIRETLYIFTTDINGNEVEFPSREKQAFLEKYSVTKHRMGEVPVISGTVTHELCLDELWKRKEYVIFDGVKYYIDTIPSSAKKNDDHRYTHELILKNERSVLDDIFFFDVVTDNTEDIYKDRYRSNSSDVNFYGDIFEFVGRLNDSLFYSGVSDRFKIVVDEGVTSDTMNINLSASPFSAAIQEIFNTYKLTYYWVGNVCHVGLYETYISNPSLEYGQGKGLLEVSKTNANYRVIDKMTGIGSSENIPYYYPNDNEYGTAVFNVTNTEKSNVQGIDISKILQYKSPFTGDFKLVRYKNNVASFGIKPIDSFINFYFNGRKNVYNGVSTCSFSGKVSDFSSDGINFDKSGFAWSQFLSNGGGAIIIKKDYDDMSSPYLNWTYFARVWLNDGSYNLVKPSNDLPVKIILKDSKKQSFDFSEFWEIRKNTYDFPSTPTIHIRKAEYTLEKDKLDNTEYKSYTPLEDCAKNILYFKDAENINNGTYLCSEGCYYDIKITSSFYFVEKGDVPFYKEDYQYFLQEIIIKNSQEIPQVSFECEKLIINEGLHFKYDDKLVSYADSGITLNSPDATNAIEYESEINQYGEIYQKLIESSLNSAATISIIGKKFIPPSGNLMPSIYRDTEGGERFYEARNNTYTNPDTGDYYTFKNECVRGKQREGTNDFDDIKPTIKGVKNASGQLIGEIAEIAYDIEDSDVKIDDTNFKHSYFYIKLHKTDGEYGFDLFKQSLESGAMKINMTSGNCSACSFEIASIKKQEGDKYIFYNPVKTDNDGRLINCNNDNEANGYIGDYIIQSEDVSLFTERQQNTYENEVWVAVKKDVETFGVVIPNSLNNYKPNVGDTFVITNILLPRVLILKAENDLTQAIIKYMAENNDDKFDFSVVLSRIWIENNKEYAGQLNENSMINIVYNDREYTLQVSSYYVNVTEDILNEIVIELKDTLSAQSGTLKQQIQDVASDSLDSMIDSAMFNKFSKEFLSKRGDDVASGNITFSKGFVSKENSYFEKGINSKGKSDIEEVISEKVNAYNAVISKAEIKEVISEILFNELGTFLKGVKTDTIASYTDDYNPRYAGYSLSKTNNNRYRLEIDELLVRVKAIFNELEIRKLSYVGGNIVISAAGGTIYRSLPLYDESGNVYAFKCWLISDDGTTKTRNWWKVGDQAKCQTFNLNGEEVLNGEKLLSVDGEVLSQDGELITYDDGTGGNSGNKYYWRLVIETGKETLEDEKQYDYIVLSNEEVVTVTGEDGLSHTCYGMDVVFDGFDSDNMKWHDNVNDYPEKGDDIVQLGNQIDEERQHAIILSTVGENAPSFEEYIGIGRIDGDKTSPWNLSKRRMTVIAPRTGDVFVAKRFEMITDSGTRTQVPVERGEYTDGMVCNYYDRVSHNGSLWLCVCKIGNKVNDTIYPPSEEYTLTDGSKIWLQQIKRGGDGYTVELTPSTMMITQNTEGNFNFSDNRVYYKVFAASSDITNDCKLLEATADDGCNVTTDTDGAEREYVVITSLNGQPDSGKIGIKIGLANGDVINRELKYYVNYLGSLRNELQNYTIIFSPNVVILNESENGTFDFEKHWVSFKVFKGKDDITYKTQLDKVAGDYDEPTGYGCVADRIEDNDGNIVIAIQNIIGRPEKGKIQATFKVDGYTIVRSIDYYINWLGTFRHTIENDVSKMIAEKTTVTVNGENVSINDAVSQLEQTSNSISSRVESAVTEINGNIETVEKSLSEISQTSNNINMAVYGDDTTEYITEAAGFKMATGSSHTYSFDDKSDLVKRMYAGAKIVAKIGVSAMSGVTNAYGSLTMKLLVNGNVIGEKTFDYEYFNYDWSTLCTLEATWGITVAVNTIELVIENNLGDWIDEDSGISDEITITSHSIKRKTIVSKELEDGLSRTGIDITQGKITLNAKTSEFTGDVNIYGTLQESNEQENNNNNFYPIDFIKNKSISIPAQSLVVLPMCSDVVCEAGGYFMDGYTFPAFQKAGTNVTITAVPVIAISNWSCLKTKLAISGSEVKEIVALNDGLDVNTEFPKMHKYMSLVCADPRLFANYDIVKYVSTAEGAESGYGMSINADNQGKNFFGNMHGRFLVNGSFTRFIALLPGQMLKLKSVIMYGEQSSAGRVNLSMLSGNPIVFWNVENASDFTPIHFNMTEGESNNYFFYPSAGNISPLTEFKGDFRETVYGHRLLEDSVWGLNGNGASGVITKYNGKPRFYSEEVLQ